MPDSEASLCSLTSSKLLKCQEAELYAANSHIYLCRGRVGEKNALNPGRLHLRVLLITGKQKLLWAFMWHSLLCFVGF